MWLLTGLCGVGVKGAPPTLSNKSFAKQSTIHSINSKKIDTLLTHLDINSMNHGRQQKRQRLSTLRTIALTPTIFFPLNAIGHWPKGACRCGEGQMTCAGEKDRQ